MFTVSDDVTFFVKQTDVVLHQNTPFQGRYRTINRPFRLIQSDQKVSVHLTITVQSSGAQRLFAKEYKERTNIR